ncbi:MAG: hypothetical protein V2J12_13525 [Gammaproteobacteria bacterium]|jgi:hypothetical protein|nr:hypothetical protein [Gammaproteobacteria bacterium]
MNQAAEQDSPQFDAESLYLEETFTDRKVGTLRRLSPVTGTGEPDPSRAVLYMGAAQAMTAAGPIPLNFDIEADSLQDACEKFAEGAQQAVEEMAKRLEEMRREQASQIVVPGQDPARGPGIIGA